MQLLTPLSQATSVALYPPTSIFDHQTPITIPTSDNAMEHAQRCGVTGLLAVSSFVEAWAKGGAVDEQLQWMRGLQFVAFGGGPLAVKVGDALARSGVNIVSLYGTTEFGCPTTLEVLPSQGNGVDGRSAPDSCDWAYMRFSKGVNVRWVPQGDGTFESQFLVRSFMSLYVVVLIQSIPGHGDAHNERSKPLRCPGLCKQRSMDAASD